MRTLFSPLTSPLRARPEPTTSARGVPLLGVLPQLIRDPLKLLDAVAAERPERVVPLKAGPARLYFLSRPEHAEHVLLTNWRNYAKGEMFWKPMRRLGGDGLPLAEGEPWLRQRRLMQPIFTARHLGALVELMGAAVTDGLTELTDVARSGAPIDMAPAMTRLAQQVVGRALFGAQLPADAEALRQAIGVAHEVIVDRMFLFFLPEWAWLPGEGALRRAVATIDAILYPFIREQRARARAATGGGSLLELLLDARDERGEGMSDRQLRDEVLSLFFAGSDTVALTLTWLWHLLEEHPEVDRRLRAEVDAVIGERAPRLEELAGLTYTKMVIQEVMRLYPPAWILPRFSVEAEVVGGCAIPARSAVVISPYLLHRNPAVWERPAVFDPERFHSERAEGRHRYAFLPFGGGPRVCIGNHFAMAEAQLVTAMLARRFRPRRAPGSRVEAHARATLAPRGGLRMTLDAARGGAR